MRPAGGEGFMARNPAPQHPKAPKAPHPQAPGHCHLGTSRKPANDMQASGLVPARHTHTHTHTHMPRKATHLLGPKGPAKIEEVTLMRPFHGNL